MLARAQKLTRSEQILAIFDGKVKRDAPNTALSSLALAQFAQYYVTLLFSRVAICVRSYAARCILAILATDSALFLPNYARSDAKHASFLREAGRPLRQILLRALPNYAR